MCWKSHQKNVDTHETKKVTRLGVDNGGTKQWVGFNGNTPSKFDFGIQLQQSTQDEHYWQIWKNNNGIPHDIRLKASTKLEL
jgi:hypothetical protein